MIEVLDGDSVTYTINFSHARCCAASETSVILWGLLRIAARHLDKSAGDISSVPLERDEIGTLIAFGWIENIPASQRHRISSAGREQIIELIRWQVNHGGSQ